MPTRKPARDALSTPKSETTTPAAKAITGFKIPTSLAQCADLLYKLEKERYALQHQAEDLKKKETLLTEHLINNLPKSDATGVVGKVARAVIKEREIVELIGTETDRFALVYEYILKNARKDPGVWSLMQRRLGEAAAKELVAAGKGKLIGAKMGKVPVVSLSKV
jgi:hypothetical protein